VREGCGAARGFAKTAGEAMENAIKAAETDALKRALVTFGNAFGLALHDREQRNVAALAAPARGAPDRREQARRRGQRSRSAPFPIRLGGR
jgi:recombination DNA repair RAD52 pathway protein